MVSVSLCMIVKNEQAVIERCLKSIAGFADEIIIADTGSNDKTKEICQKYGKVYDFIWCDDFSKARNFAFSKANCDYIMWLDADDIVPEKSFEKLMEWKTGQTDADVLMLPYKIDGNFVYYRERLLKREKGFIWQGAVHECIAPCGKIVYFDAVIEHHKMKNDKLSDRNLKIYEKNKDTLDTRGKFYYARELLTHKKTDEAIKMFEIFLEDKNAWLENKLEAHRNLASCYVYKSEFEKAIDILIKSFKLDVPRAETCCDLAMICTKLEKYEQAKFWYETAYKCIPDTQKGGFVSLDCYGYIPCLGLCVCFDKLGDKKSAEYWNEKAGVFKPDSQAVALNRSYFNSLR